MCEIRFVFVRYSRTLIVFIFAYILHRPLKAECRKAPFLLITTRLSRYRVKYAIGQPFCYSETLLNYLPPASMHLALYGLGTSLLPFNFGRVMSSENCLSRSW